MTVYTVCKENKEDEDEDEDGVGLAVADLTVINYYLETLSLFYVFLISPHHLDGMELGIISTFLFSPILARINGQPGQVQVVFLP
ncbi:hypothetical protein RJZ57_007698, partial [Blastomyces gilchristii]